MTVLPKGSVFIYPCEDLSGGTFQSLLLPHPGTSQPQVFLFDKTHNRLLEMHQISRPESSCFLTDNYLLTHGNLTTGIIFDFHFLLAPLLPQTTFVSQSDWQRQLLDEPVHGPSVTASLGLILTLPIVATVIGNLCDSKTVGEVEYFRFSKEKFVQFVCRKFQTAISDYTPLVPFIEGAVSSVLMDAIEASIFDPEVSASIRSQLGIASTKQESPAGISDSTTKKKHEPPKKKSKTDKAAPAGCQKISSFFTKKSV